MKRLILISTLLLAMLSCRNGEDIGPLYGQWVILHMTVDGTEADVDLSIYNLRFQQDIVIISSTYPIMEYDVCAGTWTLDGDRLTLNFTHHNADDNTQGYTPPAELLLQRGITVMRVLKLTSKRLVVSFNDADDQTVEYDMEKLN